MSFLDADRYLHVATSSDSTNCQGSSVPSYFSDYYPYYQGTDDRSVVANTFGCLPNVVCPQYWTNEEMTRNMKVAKMESFADTAHVSSGMHSSTIGGKPFQYSQFKLADSEYPLFFPGKDLFEDKVSVQLSACASYMSSEGQSLCVKAERDELIMPYQSFSHSDDTEFNVGQELKQLPGILPSVGCQIHDFFKCEDNNTVVTTARANYFQDIMDGTANKCPGNMGNLNLKSLDKSFSDAQASIVNEKQFECDTGEGEGKIIQHKSIDSHLSKGSTERSYVEDDSDVCIIEDISHPAPTSRSAEHGNSLNMSQSSRCGYTQPYMGGGTRPKARDEQYILRVAMQVHTFILGFLSFVVLGCCKSTLCTCTQLGFSHFCVGHLMISNCFLYCYNDVIVIGVI